MFCLLCWAFERPATSSRRKAMDYIIAGIASLGLFVYLVYALLKPERF
jgi:K+-transporting ATPase KdpF subunit